MQANTNIPHTMVPAGMHGVKWQKRICDRAKQRPRPQKQLPLSTSAEISMFIIFYDLTYTPQDSLKIQIFPMNDFENRVARLLQLTRFWEVALRLLQNVMAAPMYPKVDQRSMCSKCVETKLQEGQLRSQPWLVSRVHTNSHCYEYSPFHAVSRRSRVLAFHVCTEKWNANY
jgi:hypothetical protein